MATVTKWTPFGVALDITATGSNVVRKSATQFSVTINASWETYYSGAKTNYGMTASSGSPATSTTLNASGTNSSGSSKSFTATYSISGNGSATKTITVTFRNFNSDNGNSATKSVSFNVTVPAWTSYTIKYNANGGTGTPGSQTKWKDQTLTLSSTKPTRTGYSFQGWATSSTATTATYSQTKGMAYTANAAATLYAVWKANTYTVSYNANGGTNAPANQTKTYGKTLTLSTAKPTRTDYNFKGWATSATSNTVAYAAGASYTANAKITLYAVWELAYKKPTVTGFTVDRCDANGNVTDEGTYLLFNFAWASYQNVTEILLKWASADGVVTGSQAVTASGTNGNVNAVVGNGTITTEKTFTVNANVTDVETTKITRTINSIKLPFEAIYENGEYGVAFGKTAEKLGYADFGFKMLSSFGELITSPVAIPENQNLDELREAGYYIIPNTTVSGTITNKPPFLSEDDTGTAFLEVLRMGDGMQCCQRYWICSKGLQMIFQRIYYSNSWSDWFIVSGCSGWRSLTIESGFEAYSSEVSPKYRVNGNLVSIAGGVKPTATVTSNTNGVKFASGIAEIYRPPATITFVCQGSGINRWLLSISPDGNLYVSRYGTNNYVDMAAGAWLTFNVTYSI